MLLTLTTEQLEEQLDKFLDSVLSSRRTATGIAQMLATCQREQQDFVLQWVENIRRSSQAEIAYQFASHATQAFKLMDQEGIEAWIVHALDIYDKKGLYAAIAVLSEVENYSQNRWQKTTGLSLNEISRILETFITALSGRHLKLESADLVYTDTETLFLPPFISRFKTREDNFRLYKAIAVHLWAQTRFGTWRNKLTNILQQFPEPEKACCLFHTLERLRLDACIARELPGVYRNMQQLTHQLGESQCSFYWVDIAERLAHINATVADSYELLTEIYPDAIPISLCYQGVLKPERVEEIVALRLAREKEAFRLGLVQMLSELHPLETPVELGALAPKTPFKIEQIPDDMQLEHLKFTLYLDGIPMIPPDHVKSVMDSIIQDIGLIPEEYLIPAGDGGYKLLDEHPPERDPHDVWKGVYHEEGAFFYDEWDCDRQHYRKNWCVLRELDVLPQAESFVIKTLQQYRGLVKTLRRTFEALRGENRLLKAQPNGEDIDLDMLIRAYTETKLGFEMSDRVFTKTYKEERNIAVMFMVDMSGSTKGWINDAERESLVLLCEALETLGDRYAIYGFSGTTRKRCEIYRIKRFDEAYNNLVQQRISGITPQDYTRMGAAIRHLTRLLKEVDARIKLLITLSDGKPDDYGDRYRGIYGIEDTRQALIEAKREGIHPFCITLDTEARDYLPHMYGAVNYIVIDEVRKLPLKVSDIYRKLTSR
ncbi:MAG: nitric oxide reductase activation protein [Beggiatoa sp. IS2]|nr:MAG: nitric oxide reductase activation protein [Beggiatoa sp. IS2]